jgi:hypothetical protein
VVAGRGGSDGGRDGRARERGVQRAAHLEGAADLSVLELQPQLPADALGELGTEGERRPP